MFEHCRLFAVTVAIAATLLAPWPAAWAADTWLVGPRAPALSLTQALKQAKDGDTIALLEGEYDGEVAVIEQKKLTIKGIGKRPVLRAGGRSAEGKAIFVVRNGDITIENIEFRGARVPDGNGAGVRFERGRLLVRGCAFYDNENGLLTANFADAELVIENSEFGDAPTAVGSLPHLLYVGRINKVTISGSRFHEGFEGHLIKSRAKESVITYNMIYDGWAGQASYEIDLPNGGNVTLLGNLIGQGPLAQNRTLVAFGAEGNTWPDSRLMMVHNTLLSGGAMPARFLRIFPDRLPANTPVFVVNNVSAGVGVLELGNGGTFAGNGHTLGRWLRDPPTLDFGLPSDSRLRGSAVDVRNIGGRDLTPQAEFMLPIGVRPIKPPAQWSPGAFQ